MKYTKQDDVDRIVRLTGSQDNILGVSFSNNDSPESNIEGMEWPIPKGEQIRTSRKEILERQIFYENRLQYMDPPRSTCKPAFRLFSRHSCRTW